MGSGSVRSEPQKHSPNLVSDTLRKCANSAIMIEDLRHRVDAVNRNSGLPHSPSDHLYTLARAGIESVTFVSVKSNSGLYLTLKPSISILPSVGHSAVESMLEKLRVIIYSHVLVCSILGGIIAVQTEPVPDAATQKNWLTQPQNQANPNPWGRRPRVCRRRAPVAFPCTPARES